MSSQLVAWDRLVRYIPTGDSATVRYGEPIVASSDSALVAQLADEGKLRVKVLEAAHPLDAKPTGAVEGVKKLLGPLEPADVPIIRCIGLNYKSHSKRATRQHVDDRGSCLILNSSRNRATASKLSYRIHQTWARGG